MELPAGRSFPGPDTPQRLQVDRATLAVLERAQATYGDIVRFFDAGRGACFFVNDSALIRQILVRRHTRYAKGRDFERVKMLLGNGIIVSDGATWRRHRRMLQPSFSKTRINRLVQTIHRHVLQLRETWQAQLGQRIDMTAACNQYALDVILTALFSDDVDALVDDSGRNLFRFLSQDYARDLRAVTRLRSARERVQALLAQRRERPPPEPDLLQGLLDARDRDGEPLSDREVIDEVMTLVVAGYETSAGTLNWAWLELSRHPGIAERLVAEWRAAFARHAGDVSAAVHELPLHRQVLAETLRLYPPVWLYSRRIASDDEFAGVDLPAGAEVYVSPYLLHRRHPHWRTAEAFQPERFASDPPDGAYIPFSLGPRRCIGEHFAYLEMQLHLAVLLDAFQPVPAFDDPPALELGINLRSATPIHLTLERRPQ